MTEKDLAPDDDGWDIEKARAAIRGDHDNSKGARNNRRKKLAKSADKRFRPKSGRTEQFNFRSAPGLKKQAQEAAASEGIVLAEWMERAVEAALKAKAGAL